MKNWRQNADYRVYLVTDRDLCKGRGLLEVVSGAVRGGATMIQLREKNADSREFLALAKVLVREIQTLGVPVLINDRADIALASGAAGVHLGQSDLPVEAARRILGNQALIGLSLDRREDLEDARQADLDYLAVSPVFSTSTKTDAAPAWGLDGLAWARRQTTLPVIAIGNIHLDNAAQVLEAGASGLAVVSEICSAPDPAGAAADLLALFSVRGRTAEF